jgi:uncharacterized protein (TIGR02594 family)
MTATISDIQRALSGAGYDPGPSDGFWGRRSIRACRAFQVAHGLEADGVCGTKTLAALLPVQAGTILLPWLEEAQRLRGTLERPGPASNPTILDWAGPLGIPYRGDDIPWCGLFVAHCIGAPLPDEPLPSNPLWARGWATWGRAVAPGRGAVLVFWRGTKAGANGHVGFYVAEDASAFHVLGGNQSDRVSVARVAKSRLLAARWPATALTLWTAGTVSGAAVGGLSANEA